MPKTTMSTDWNVELENIGRQRKYAELLRQQGIEPLKSETAGGMVIPIHPFQGLAKLLQAYSGRRGEEIATEQAKDVTSRRNKAQASALSKAYDPITTQAKEAQMGEMGEVIEPAVPASSRMPTPQESLSALEGSGIPELQQSALGQRQFMAQKRIEQEMQDAQMKRNIAMAKALSGGDGTGAGMSPIMKIGEKGGLGFEFNPYQQGKLTLDQLEYYQKTGEMPPGMARGASRGAPLQGGTVPQGGAGISPQQQREHNLKLLQEKPAQTLSLKATMQQYDNALKQLSNLEGMGEGLSNVTGPVYGRTPSIRGESTNAQAALDTLKAQIGVQVLQAMREASKTGGAVGQVTEREWPILQNQLAALQQSQTTDQFIKNLATVKETINRAKQRSMDAYKEVYGDIPGISVPTPRPEKGGKSKYEGLW